MPVPRETEDLGVWARGKARGPRSSQLAGPAPKNADVRGGETQRYPEMGLVEPETPGVRGQPEVDETPLKAENPGVQDGEPQIPCSAGLGGPEIPSVQGTETQRPPSTRLVGLENPGVQDGEAQRPSSVGLVGPENPTIWGQPSQTGENPGIQEGEPQRSQSPQLAGPENPGVQGREACIPPSTRLARPENLDIRVPWARGGPVTLNVGGKLYTTTVETLTRCPDSMLAAMFRGGPRPSHKDGWGHYIIDRDGPTFRHVLNFLRTGQLQLPEGYSELGLLAAEADFYQLRPLQEALSQWDAVQRRLGSAAVLHTDVDTQQRVVHFTVRAGRQCYELDSCTLRVFTANVFCTDRGFMDAFRAQLQGTSKAPRAGAGVLGKAGPGNSLFFQEEQDGPQGQVNVDQQAQVNVGQWGTGRDGPQDGTREGREGRAKRQQDGGKVGQARDVIVSQWNASSCGQYGPSSRRWEGNKHQTRGASISHQDSIDHQWTCGIGQRDDTAQGSGAQTGQWDGTTSQGRVGVDQQEEADQRDGQWEEPEAGSCHHLRLEWAPRPAVMPAGEYAKQGVWPLHTVHPGGRELATPTDFLEEVLKMALAHGFRLDSTFPDPSDLLTSRSLRFIRP